MNVSKTKITSVIVFISILIFASCKKKEVAGNPPIPSAPGTSWTTVNTSNGLCADHITDIEMDGSGSVWVSSKKSWIVQVDTVGQFHSCSSIAKLNSGGYVIQSLDSNTSAIYKSSISSFGFNSLGNLYFGTYFLTGNGTWLGSKLVEKNSTYTVYDGSYLSTSSFATFFFNTEGLWYCGGTSSLVNLNNGTLSGYNSSNSIIQGGYLVDLEEFGGNGDFVFSTSSQLCKMSNGQLTKLYDLPQVTYLDKDSSGNLWLIANTNSLNNTYELIKYDGNDTTIFETPIKTSGNYISDLEIDSHNNIWIAVSESYENDNSGLFKWNSQTWTKYTPDNSPLHSWKLTKLKVDNVGNLWIGSYDNGLIQLNEFGTRN